MDLDSRLSAKSESLVSRLGIPQSHTYKCTQKHIPVCMYAQIRICTHTNTITQFKSYPSHTQTHTHTHTHTIPKPTTGSLTNTHQPPHMPTFPHKPLFICIFVELIMEKMRVELSSQGELNRSHPTGFLWQFPVPSAWWRSSVLILLSCKRALYDLPPHSLDKWVNSI